MALAIHIKAMSGRPHLLIYFFRNVESSSGGKKRQFLSARDTTPCTASTSKENSIAHAMPVLISPPPKKTKQKTNNKKTKHTHTHTKYRSAPDQSLHVVKSMHHIQVRSMLTDCIIYVSRVVCVFVFGV